VDKDKMKNRSDKDDTDQSVDHQDVGKQETPEDQSKLSLDEQLAKSQEQASKNWDKVLRLQAEIENLRKRTLRDVENASRGSIERVIMEMLPILDSFELGLDLKTETIDEYKTFKEGQEASMMLMNSLFYKLSIETIDPSEMRYDPELHEVISTQEDDSVEPGYIIKVIQKGYRLKERLLRPARVIVCAEKNKKDSLT
jgi:molecular chaperone GrpE|tara:strand:+ start:688 stop:1281 length:594 start_codon:yes stop_codon:yes gene_type:complete